MPKGFQKGIATNPKGRGKGTPNKTTKEAKEILNQILFAELPNIKAALSGLRAKDKYKYLDTFAKLLSYSLPKKTDVTSDDLPIQQLNIVVSGEAAKDAITKLNEHN
mgnify:CR=1 FL=1